MERSEGAPFCARCGMRVGDRRELLVGFGKMRLVAFHADCRSPLAFAFRVNSLGPVLFSVVIVVLSGGLLFSDPSLWWVGFAAMLPAWLRAYSWFRFERRLPIAPVRP